jgi:hypothetical protein
LLLTATEFHKASNSNLCPFLFVFRFSFHFFAPRNYFGHTHTYTHAHTHTHNTREREIGRSADCFRHPPSSLFLSLPLSLLPPLSPPPPPLPPSLPPPLARARSPLCHQRGGCFAGVHDSFWTHAADYELLSQTLREQFVALYSLPILAKLKQQLEAGCPEAGPLPPLPKKGDLDLRVVLKSPYFFS